MNELQTFTYRQAPIRTIQRENETWWVLKDVCGVLGIENATDVSKRLDSDEVTRFNLGGLSGESNIINESGLYNVILRSDKPEAKPFRKWVTSEVLPTIRKTGGYVNNDELFINTYFSNVDETAKQAFRATLQNVRALNTKIEQDKPKVVFADAVTASTTSILIGELAKLLKQNGVADMGQNRLFNWLRNNGYLIKRYGTDFNAPTQRSMELKLFEVKESSITHNDGRVTINRTTKVTGKGQQYFVNLFLKQQGGKEKC